MRELHTNHPSSALFPSSSLIQPRTLKRSYAASIAARTATSFTDDSSYSYVGAAFALSLLSFPLASLGTRASSIALNALLNQRPHVPRPRTGTHSVDPEVRFRG